MRDPYPVPPEWEQAGARFGRDGLLYLQCWRRGFTPHELSALFFECQAVRSLTHENKRLVTELERAQLELSQAEARAAFYRRQLILESRLGAMLLRLA